MSLFGSNSLGSNLLGSNLLSPNLADMPTLINGADLSQLNTLGVSASAQHLATVTSVDQLQALLHWRKLRQRDTGQELPILVLGGGSNVILGGDFAGLVIRMAITGIEEVAEDDDFIWVRVGGGESWHNWVQECMNFHYWGLENLALIPGTVGAAPIQNIGAYGVELRDCFAELSAVEINSGLPVTFDVDACGFGYRDSVFKQRLKDKYIVTSVTFKLRNQPQVTCDYPALQQYFQAQGITCNKDQLPSPQQIFDAVCAIRASKLPDPADIPNVGSFFKNPVVSAAQFANLQETYPNIVGYPQGADQVKLAAGWLIDRAGWKGHQDNGVGVHSEQALVLVNPSRCSGQAVLQLATTIQQDIQQRFNVALEIEPRVY